MVNKIVNNKISWIVLGIVLVTLSISLFFISSNNDSNDVVIDKDKYEEEYEEEKVIFKLVGDSEITIQANSNYEELGTIAVLSNDTDLSNNVEVENNIDYTKPGTYDVIYTLIYKNEKYTLKRIVKVEGIDVSDINIKLNGNETIYLNINDNYTELGAVATLNNEDISNKIKIEKDFDNLTIGTHEVKYTIEENGIAKEVIRKVIVFNIDDLFTVDEDNLIINVTLNDNFSYVRLPSGVVNQNEVISYKVPSSGNYEFKIYTKDYKEYTKIVNVLKQSSIVSIDTTPPSGTCEAVIKNSKTSVTVKSNSNIIKYNYNGVESNSSMYTVDKTLKDAYVILTGKNGKTTKINCTIKYEYLPVITPKSDEKIKYKAESDSLKVYITTKDGWFLTRIWTRDPANQLKKHMTSTSAVKPIKLLNEAVVTNNLQNKILVGFNASGIVLKGEYYKDLAKNHPEYNLKEPSSLLIYNGKVIFNNYDTVPINSIIYYMDSNGELKYIPKFTNQSTEERKKIFQSVIDSGATNTFTFNPVLVENGKTLTATRKDDYKAKRQAICQVDANNFILITTDSSKMYIQPFANFVGTLGCKIAFNLDGGGSTSLYFKNTNDNKITTVKGGERENGTVMYFTES